MALRVVSPEGSALPANARVGGAIAEIAKALRTRDVTEPTFLPSLNLYLGAATYSGGLVTLPFWSDKAGTQTAGSVKLTFEGVADASSTSVSYPLTISIAIDISGGALPSTGAIKLAIVSDSGANTMKGSLTIRQQMKLELDLALATTGVVSGTIGITQNDAVMKCTGVTGQLDGELACALSVSPYGWTGTGKFGILTGEMELSVNEGSAVSTATVNHAGIINLTYGDGTTDTVANAFDAPLTGGDGTTTAVTGGTSSAGSSSGSTSSGGGGTAPVTSATYVMTAGSFTSVGQLADSGAFTGVIAGSSGGAGSWVVASSASDATGTPLAGGGQPVAFTASGAILGNRFTDPTNNPDGSALAFVWATAAAVPTPLSTTDTYNGATTQLSATRAHGISAAGLIVGRAGATSNLSDVYWPSATANPLLLQVPVVGQYFPSGAYPGIGISRNGHIVDDFYSTVDSQYHLLYWSDATAAPVDMGSPAVGVAFRVNNKGEIAVVSPYADECIGNDYYASPTSTGVALPTLGKGDPKCDNQILELNDNSILVGVSLTDSLSDTHGVIWQNEKIIDMNSFLPAGTAWYVQSCAAINDNNQVLCRPNGGPYDSKGATPAILFSLH